jgi:tRNA threonylcarbamoyladenosine biosynthesis protein TsaE
MEKTLATLEALQAEAAAFVTSLTPRSDRATLVTLSGELGAGKTSFTQGVARALSVNEHVTSPTFVLEKIYALPNEGGRSFTRLAHLDAYRLEGANALAPLGFSELMQDAATLVVVEWPEKVADALPEADYALTLTVNPDTSRSLIYTPAYAS